MATRQILADLVGAFEQGSAHPVEITAMGGVQAARMVRAGAPADIVVLAAKVMEALEAEGHILAGSRAGFARSGIAVAVRSGAPRPSIADADSVRQAILTASTVCYSTGPSGDHLLRLWTAWGIAERMAPRTVQAPPGVPVAAILARGDAELGFQQFSELLDQPGIDVVGPLPPEIQAVTLFSAGIASTSCRRDEARALIDRLVSPAAEATKRRYGMEPA